MKFPAVWVKCPDCMIESRSDDNEVSHHHSKSKIRLVHVFDERVTEFMGVRCGFWVPILRRDNFFFLSYNQYYILYILWQSVTVYTFPVTKVIYLLCKPVHLLSLGKISIPVYLKNSFGECNKPEIFLNFFCDIETSTAVVVLVREIVRQAFDYYWLWCGKCETWLLKIFAGAISRRIIFCSLHKTRTNDAKYDLLMFLLEYDGRIIPLVISQSHASTEWSFSQKFPKAN